MKETYIRSNNCDLFDIRIRIRMFISTKYHTGNNHWTYIRLQNNNCRYFHRYGFGFWQRPFFNHPVLMEKGDVFHYQKDGVGPHVE